ncbi:uncharacterized protein A1O5_05925 [Cladophialophora psammophila CBS 110553]|uniref:Uncharacterized protein n=1 Tax=Cladophialophora psammophila CBS 110553 TaxID=1182543 RepID=W9WSN1_9EURO|nr:uncharacterized protein A1O5_05925 [Cladophialophora psammophila CBS 110553]EXJ70933.1 hypothetical protein A1O5_05925 [Cladophialophora psammophila CBS 110553]
MGCGSSSLKGADIPDLNSQPTTATGAQPIRKIRTNFSEVDYDQNARERRLTEYAPHEQPPPVREESHDFTAEQSGYEQWQQYDTQPGRQSYDAGPPMGYVLPQGSMSGPDAADRDRGASLKPYQTFDGGDWDNQDASAQRQESYVNGTQETRGDPTSNASKNQFAAANDPANPSNQEGHHSQPNDHHRDQRQASRYNNNDDELNNVSPISYNTGTDPGANPDIHGDDDEPKKSWLGQKYASFQSAKRGSGLSDEDVLKYTGKDRKELNEWVQNRPGVGPNQEAGRVGSDSGLAVGAPWS